DGALPNGRSTLAPGVCRHAAPRSLTPLFASDSPRLAPSVVSSFTPLVLQSPQRVPSPLSSFLRIPISASIALGAEALKIEQFFWNGLARLARSCFVRYGVAVSFLPRCRASVGPGLLAVLSIGCGARTALEFRTFADSDDTAHGGACVLLGS